jgi:biphenyl-2,3-diol 1,2-dioxygenase
MPSIAKLGHVALITPDLDTSLWFWRDVVGLEEVARADGTIHLRAWGEFEHHSLSLTAGPSAGVDHIGWRAGAGADVGLYADALAAAGADVERVPAGAELGQGEAIRFAVPEGGGHPFEIYFDIEKGRGPEGQRSRLKNNAHRMFGHGISPRRIDHVNLWTANPEPPKQWLQDHLGFKERELVRLSDGPLVGTWMAVTSLVHDLAYFGDPTQQLARFHHLSYFQDNFQDVLRGMDILLEHGITPDLGPGRHGISQAFFCYVRDPGSGHRLELFSGGYQIFDPDWEPVVWNETELKEGLVWWGPEYMPGTGHAMDATTPCHVEAPVAGAAG